jgi:siroheme synthase (precorrin-2 oxidase/ferrochelatase)
VTLRTVNARDFNVVPWFPVALKLRGRRCLVVGSSDEAAARARALAEAGADVVRVPQFSPPDLDGVWLAVLGDRNPELADRLDQACEERRIFFAAVDDTRVGSYSHLAIAKAGSVICAIGTHGDAPALARRLRELLQGLFERANLAAFTERHAALRRATPSERRREVLGADVAEIRIDGELVLPPNR